MKTLFLYSIFFLGINTEILAQVYTVYGIFDIDSCTFENSYYCLNIDTSNQNVWQIGTPAKNILNSAFSAPNAIITDTINSYPVSNHSYFDFCFDASSWFSMVVSFKHKFDTDTLEDGGYIEISYDRGITWHNVLDDPTVNPLEGFYTENLYTSQDSLNNGINGFSGTSSDWIYTRIQWIWVLPVKSMSVDTITLRFNFTSDSIQNNKEGWLIDNLTVSYSDIGSNTNEIEIFSTDINIFPNPMTEEATIYFNNLQNEYIEAKIFNSVGQLVKQIPIKNDSSFNISKENLLPGNYYVQLRSKNGLSITEKLIVE